MTIRKFIAFIFVVMLFANSALASHQCCEISSDDDQKLEQADCHKKSEDKTEKQNPNCQCVSHVSAYNVSEGSLESIFTYSVGNRSNTDSIVSAYINPIDAPPKHNS